MRGGRDTREAPLCFDHPGFIWLKIDIDRSTYRIASIFDRLDTCRNRHLFLEQPRLLNKRPEPSEVIPFSPTQTSQTSSSSSSTLSSSSSQIAHQSARVHIEFHPWAFRTTNDQFKRLGPSLGVRPLLHSPQPFMNRATSQSAFSTTSPMAHGLRHWDRIISFCPRRSMTFRLLHRW